MTQDQFAKEAGMVRQTLSSFERGEKCSKKTKYKIAFTICSLLNANYSKMKADDILFLKQFSARLGYYYESFKRESQNNTKMDSEHILTLRYIRNSLSIPPQVFADLLGISMGELASIENADSIPLDILCKLYFTLKILLEKPRHYNLTLSQVYSMNDFVNKLYKIIQNRQTQIIDESYNQ